MRNYRHIYGFLRGKELLLRKPELRLQRRLEMLYRELNHKNLELFYTSKFIQSFLDFKVDQLKKEVGEHKKIVKFLRSMPNPEDNLIFGVYEIFKASKHMNKVLNVFRYTKFIHGLLLNYREHLSVRLKKRAIKYNQYLTLEKLSGKFRFIDDAVGSVYNFKFDKPLYINTEVVYRPFLKKRELLIRAKDKYTDKALLEEITVETSIDGILDNFMNVCLASFYKFKGSSTIHLDNILLNVDLDTGFSRYANMKMQLNQFSFFYLGCFKQLFLDNKNLSFNEVAYLKIRKYMYIFGILNRIYRPLSFVKDLNMGRSAEGLFVLLKSRMVNLQKSILGVNEKSKIAKFKVEFLTYMYQIVRMGRQIWRTVKKYKKLGLPLKSRKNKRVNSLRYKFKKFKRISDYRIRIIIMFLKSLKRYMKSLGRSFNMDYMTLLQTKYVKLFDYAEKVSARGGLKLKFGRYRPETLEQRHKRIRLQKIKERYLRQGRTWIDYKRKKRRYKRKFFGPFTALQWRGFDWRFKNIKNIKKDPEIYSSMRKDPEVTGLITKEGEIYRYGNAYITLKKTYSNLFLQVTVFDEILNVERVFFVESLGQAAGFGNKKFKNKKKKRSNALYQLLVIDAMRKLAAYGIRNITVRTVNKVVHHYKATLDYMLNKGGFKVVGYEWIYKKPHGKGLRKKKMKRK